MAEAQASGAGAWPSHKAWEVLIVSVPVTVKKIQEHDARKPNPIFRGAFDLGLILIVHLTIHQLGRLFE